MTVRELVVLGTASQAPTRTRNHNGYLLRWDGEAFLFDPGEGTQRQMLLAGVPSSAVTRLCLTHFHGGQLPWPLQGAGGPSAGDLVVAEDLATVPVPRRR